MSGEKSPGIIEPLPRLHTPHIIVGDIGRHVVRPRCIAYEQVLSCAHAIGTVLVIVAARAAIRVKVINIPRSRLKVIARATTYVAISIKPGDRRIIHKLSTIEVVIFSLNDERAVGGKGVENKVVGRAFARGIEDHDSYIVNTVASQWPGVLHKEIGFVSAHEGIGYFRQSQERGGDLGAI